MLPSLISLAAMLTTDIICAHKAFETSFLTPYVSHTHYTLSMLHSIGTSLQRSSSHSTEKYIINRTAG